MKRVVLSISILFFTIGLIGQEEEIRLEGKITFKASENIYARFASTAQIQVGDTLFIAQNGILSPCIQVTQKSSSSCVCIRLKECSIAVNDVVIYLKKAPVIEEKPDIPIIQEELDKVEESEQVERLDLEAPPAQSKEKIRARISAATYSNLSNGENEDRHRTLLRYSFNADHINNSKFSLESYINYRKNFIQSELPDGYQTSFLNIYNLAVKYDVDSTLSLSFGRKINRKIASIGPIDGLQVDKYLKNFYLGAVAGFKPDISGFGFNSNLYEFGAYMGHFVSKSSVYSMTTLGILEQHNGSPIDRRYAYVQHSSTLWKKLNFFTSAEVDIYDRVNGISSNQPRLTNLYISTRYRVQKGLSFSLSYDARKRIIYYETLRTDVERLLADDEQRQGIRARINVRPFKYINAAFSYGSRFQSDNQNKSNNMNTMISHSNLPMISGRLSVSYNRNTSNYLTSKIMSFRYSRTLIKRKLQGNFYYRNVTYAYGSSEFNSSQNYYGSSFTLRLTKTVRLSILGELSTRNTEERIRINTKLIKRFKNKK